MIIVHTHTHTYTQRLDAHIYDKHSRHRTINFNLRLKNSSSAIQSNWKPPIVNKSLARSIRSVDNAESDNRFSFSASSAWRGTDEPSRDAECLRSTLFIIKTRSGHRQTELRRHFYRTRRRGNTFTLN